MARIVLLFLVEKIWVSCVGVKATRYDGKAAERSKIGNLPEV